MLTKNKILLFLILVLAFPSASFALTRFPKGTCTLEGLLVKAMNEPSWYFIVNPKTNSETRFKLRSFVPANTINEKGQYVEATIDIPTETFSLYGEAELKNVEKFLNPYTDVKQYSLLSEVRKACSLDRYPNSISKKSSKKTGASGRN
jgi:hypothetical protein